MGKITWLGHAAFSVELDGKVVLVDPFLSGNPKASTRPEDISRADVVIVTHDHPDHFGDCVAISKRLGSKVVALYETAAKAQSQGASIVGANIGSGFDVEGLRVAFTMAVHTGNPSGVVVAGSEFSFYHAGDTGLFGDMKLIGQRYKPHVALLPIGGFYTMGFEDAAIATSWVRPRVVIPMHYGTFPGIDGEPKKFEAAVRRSSPRTKVVVLKQGESVQVPLRSGR